MVADAGDLKLFDNVAWMLPSHGLSKKLYPEENMILNRDLPSHDGEQNAERPSFYVRSGIATKPLLCARKEELRFTSPYNLSIICHRSFRAPTLPHFMQSIAFTLEF